MADPAHEQTDGMIEEIRQRVSREYLRAYEEAEAKLDDYLERFRAKDEIHRESVAGGAETEADYREWRRGQILVGKRWREMVDTLAEDYRNADRVAASIVNGYAPDAYAVNHDYATFQVEKGSGLDTSYTLYDRATVERLIRDRPDLLPAVRVDGKKDLRWNRQHIASAVTQGVLQGEDLRQVSKRIRSVADMDERAAMRTARTAMTGAQNAGRVGAYRRAEGMGIRVRKRWLATLDGRTRHSHRSLDGEVVGMEESFSNGLSYPGDPSGAGSEVYNCRCTLAPVVDGADPEEGVRHSNLGGVSYERWRGGERRAPVPTPAPAEAARRAFRLDDQGRAVRWMMERAGVQVHEDNTVTLYHATPPENAESIRREGFRGSTAPVNGGDFGHELGPRSFFGYDRGWVEETWGASGAHEVMEVRIPVSYLHFMGTNTSEVLVEGRILPGQDGVWVPDCPPSSTAWRRRALKRYMRQRKG